MVGAGPIVALDTPTGGRCLILKRNKLRVCLSDVLRKRLGDFVAISSSREIDTAVLDFAIEGRSYRGRADQSYIGLFDLHLELMFGKTGKVHKEVDATLSVMAVLK